MRDFTLIIPSMNERLLFNCRQWIPSGWNVIAKDGDPHRHYDEVFQPGYIRTQWAILMDEDCYLIDPQGLLDLVESAEESGFSFVGMQDGGCLPIRVQSPVMINPFLSAFNMERLAGNYPKIKDFEARCREYSPLSRFHCGKVDWCEYEPFYRFWLGFLEKGELPYFLNVENMSPFHQRFSILPRISEPPTVVLGTDGNPIAVHSWWTRQVNLNPHWLDERLGICWDYALSERRKAGIPVPSIPFSM